MKRKSYILWAFVIMALVSWALTSVSIAAEKESLQFSCAAQVYNAFVKDILADFTRDTEIEIDLYVSSSPST